MKMEIGEVKMPLNRIKMLVVSAGNLFQEYLVALLGSTWQHQRTITAVDIVSTAKIPGIQ